MLGLCFLRFFVCTKCSLAFFSSVCCKLDVVGSGSSDGCAFLVSESSSPRPHGPGRKLLLSSLYSPITRRELDVGGDKRWRKLHRQLWCAQVSQVVLPVSKLLFFGGNLSFVFCLWEDDDCHFGREGESRRRSLARLSALEPGNRSSGLFTMLDP